MNPRLPFHLFIAEPCISNSFKFLHKYKSMSCSICSLALWCHDMDILSALLVFHSPMASNAGFEFFRQLVRERLERCRWFQMPWRSCNGIKMQRFTYFLFHDHVLLINNQLRLFLTHRGWAKMTTVSNAFPRRKTYQFRVKISLKFVLKGPINNIIALVQIMAWCWPGDKPLSEPMW